MDESDGAHETSNRFESVSRTQVPPAAGGKTASRRFVVFGGGLIVVVLVPLFIALGQWQWHKAAVKEERQHLLDARTAEPPLLLTTTLVDAEAVRYRRMTVRGVYEPAWQVLIDNRIHRNQAGYHVVTPLRIDGGSANGMRVLVNRGWIATGNDRSRLPAVDTPTGSVMLQATAVVPGTRFFTLGPEPVASRERPWPTVWQNLDLARYRQAVDFPLQPIVLQLDPASDTGFIRDWPRPDERIERHVSYAWQWFGFAAAAMGIWLYFLLRLWSGTRDTAP